MFSLPWHNIYNNSNNKNKKPKIAVCECKIDIGSDDSIKQNAQLALPKLHNCWFKQMYRKK